MKNIVFLVSISIAGFLFPTKAQSQLAGYQADAIRYGQSLSGGGSARIRAMGGAATALGGDIGTVYLNPAGLGFYNRSDFSITPTFHSNATEAAYFGTTDYQFKNKLNISNLGLVFRGPNPQPDGEGWLGGSFSISYQQLNNFNRDISYAGRNPNNTYADSFLQFGDQDIDRLLNNNDAHTVLAFNTYLIDDSFFFLDDKQDTVFYYDTFFPVTDAEFPVRQAETIRTSGSQGQWNFAYGGNFGDKLYVGAGIGLPTLRYRRESTYEERVDDNLYAEFPGERENFPNNRLLIFEDLLQEGTGINATLGFIARPMEFLTLGLSYRTPTFYSIEETSYLRYENYFITENPNTGRQVEEEDAEQAPFNFNLRTPGVLNVGAAYFIEKSGVVTADIEYTDYGNSRLTDSRNFLRDESQALSENLSAVVNYRLGGEYRYQNMRFRLGYAYQASPYTVSSTENLSQNTLSSGLGIRLKSFYADLAIAGTSSNRLYHPYQTDVARAIDEEGFTVYQETTSPEVSIENRLTSALLTIGFNF